MTELEERAYVEGQRMAHISLLRYVLRELSDYPAHDGDDVAKDIQIARLELHRQEAIQALRRACDEFGDNEWTDDLHLADVVEKHLARHIREFEERMVGPRLKLKE